MERNIGEHIFLCSVLVFEPHMVKFDLTFCHGNVFCIFICDIDFSSMTSMIRSADASDLVMSRNTFDIIIRELRINST